MMDKINELVTAYDEKRISRRQLVGALLMVSATPLSASQQNRVTAWSTALGQQNEQWIGNRAHWQAQFIDAVKQRQSADFPQKMQQLLIDRESLWTPEYRAAYAQTEAAARSLIVDLMAESTAQQRLKLTQKIDGVRSDFKALKCLKAAAD